jgi:molecular chaperone GrpE
MVEHIDDINNVTNEENQDTHFENEDIAQTEESFATEQPTEQQPEKEPKSNGFFGKKDKKNKHAQSDIQVENDKLKAENAELNDKFLRLYSEFDNYRKRTQKEKLDIIQNAAESLIVSLLPVVDDMERAIAYSELPSANIDSVKEGQGLIMQKLNNLLKNKGLSPINTDNATFDTDYHEAVSFIPAPSEEEKGKIAEEIEKGYTLNNKVIRYSKVVIYQ